MIKARTVVAAVALLAAESPQAQAPLGGFPADWIKQVSGDVARLRQVAYGSG